MVIMVFKNINQIQIQIQKKKKKKNYILTGLACSVYSNQFFLQIWNRDRNSRILKLRTNHTESIRKSNQA